MEYRSVGDSGLRVSPISLGAWLTYGSSVDDGVAKSIIDAAIDGGINFIDVADVYARGEAERTVGRAIADRPRHKLVLSSKVFGPMSDDPNDRGLSRKHIMESIDRSLARLNTDYLDLYFCHRFDPDTPLLETAWAMHDLIRRGKVLYWGTSMWTPAQLEELHRVCEAHQLSKPIVEQPRYSLVDRSVERGLRKTCQHLGMGMTVYSPLAMGLLTGKYNGGVPEDSRGANNQWLVDMSLDPKMQSKLRAFCELAETLGCTPAQLALRWLTSRPGVTSAITGATRVSQVESNLGALRVNIPAEVTRKLDALFVLEAAT